MAISLTTPFLPSLKPPSTSNNGVKLPSLQGGVHPVFYQDANVYCNGERVMTMGGTQEAYREKLRKNYGELSSLMEIPVLRHGEIVLPQRKKGAKGKGKK